MSDFTCILFARPSFVEGFARVIDVAGTLNVYNTSHSGNEADCRALAADWSQVAVDIRVAAHHESQELAKLKR